MRVGGLDVGVFADHSVLAVLDREAGVDVDCWVVRKIIQMPLRVPMARQIPVLKPDLDTLDILAVDAGGSGQGVPDLITAPRVVPIVITGGTGKGKLTKGRVTVGKSHLIQGMMQMMYHRELRVDPSAPGRDLLRREMQAFQYQPNGRFRKAEAAPGEHDDSVLALSLAAYIARRT